LVVDILSQEPCDILSRDIYFLDSVKRQASLELF